MDYTLSQYRPETFEVLAYNLTITKLVNNFNYPKAGCPASPLRYIVAIFASNVKI